MAAIEIFKNESFGEVRVAGTSEKPLFCLADVCRVLEIKNVADCKSRLDQRGVVLTDTPTHNQYGAEVIQKLVYINEKNLYKVIMRSDKPQAEPFQDWVCGEVLPTLRKTGKYSVQKQYPIPRTFSEALRLAADQQEEIEEQRKMIEAKDAKIAKDKPKVIFADAVSTSQRSCLIAELAKILKQNGGEHRAEPIVRMATQAWLSMLKRTILQPTHATGARVRSFRDKTDHHQQARWLDTCINDYESDRERSNLLC